MVQYNTLSRRSFLAGAAALALSACATMQAAPPGRLEILQPEEGSFWNYDVGGHFTLYLRGDTSDLRDVRLYLSPLGGEEVEFPVPSKEWNSEATPEGRGIELWEMWNSQLMLYTDRSLSLPEWAHPTELEPELVGTGKERAVQINLLGGNRKYRARALVRTEQGEYSATTSYTLE